MDSFFALLCFMGRPCDDSFVDIVGNLPPEVATNILRNLDPASLLSAALVNRRWLSLVKSDSVLRKRVLSQLKKQKKMRTRALMFNCRVLRGNSSAKPFEKRNERYKVEMPIIAADAMPHSARTTFVPVVTRLDSSNQKIPVPKSTVNGGILSGIKELSVQIKKKSVLPSKDGKKKSAAKSFRQRLLRV